jgi:hypothetical protein
MKTRDDLPQFFVDKGYKVGAEIGVYKGEFTEKFCKAGLKMYAIDPWMAFDSQGRTQRVQERQNFLYEHTKRFLAPYPNCVVLRATSEDALYLVKDGSLDFVYIDGDHTFKHVAHDIEEWSKKVRKGGIVAGHDYYCTSVGANNVIMQVKHVVDAYCKTFGIENLVVFGKDDSTKDNSYPSWYFLKD